jgi:hypothetical protein
MDTAEINTMSNLHTIIIIIIIIGHAVSSPNKGVLHYKLKTVLFVKNFSQRMEDEVHHCVRKMLSLDHIFSQVN